jgi:SAM-dependent methyltransferase
MDFESIRSYWENRATQDSSAQSTTQDIYLREIEYHVLRGIIQRIKPLQVMDVGCGDGLTTVRMSNEFPQIIFVGCDYSDAMLSNASKNIKSANVNNMRVCIADVTRSLPDGLFDLVYTTRCLINLPTWELQEAALDRIIGRIQSNGYYAMIENFIEGHDNFNKLRIDFGLDPIPVRDHNKFFNMSMLRAKLDPKFDLIENVNISSSYYVVSRIIYSKLCQIKGDKPNYLDPHHEWGSKLPFAGENGPVRLTLWKKK